MQSPVEPAVIPQLEEVKRPAVVKLTNNYKGSRRPPTVISKRWANMGLKQRDDAIIHYELLVIAERDNCGWDSLNSTERDAALCEFNNKFHREAVEKASEGTPTTGGVVVLLKVLSRRSSRFSTPSVQGLVIGLKFNLWLLSLHAHLLRNSLGKLNN